MSHEQLNIGHQILGRVIQTLLTLHAIFYLNYFTLLGLLTKRTGDRDVIIGLTCISIFTTLGATALGIIRKWNYRVFYTVHVIGASALLPLLFLHVHHVRPFVVECIVVLLLNVLLRTLNTKQFSGGLSLIPGTNLVKVTVPLSGPTRQWKPGQHVYLHPPSTHDSKLPGRLRTNPFTVASLPKKDGQLLLIARALNGNTRTLAATARSAEIADGNSGTTLTIEGPYGVFPHLPNFALFDRILLVAGGVGATFIIPLWRHILDSRHDGHIPKEGDVRLVWAVRKLAETSWAFPNTAKTIEEGEEKEIYVTGGNGDVGGSTDTIELAETETLVDADDEKGLIEQGVLIKRKRPDLRDIVDEAFSGHVARVAVLVCGPAGMGDQLRYEVGRWVRRGKDVFYHAEAFGL
jgi:ferredoxin-NADP reductase